MHKVRISSESFSTFIVSFLTVDPSAITRPVSRKAETLKMALAWLARG